MEDIIKIKKEIAAKAKLTYNKRKAEGKTQKKIIPKELQKKRGRPKKEPIILILDDKPTGKISKPRGRKPNPHLTELLIIPKYIKDKLNKIKKDKEKDRIKEIIATQKIVRQNINNVY